PPRGSPLASAVNATAGGEPLHVTMWPLRRSAESQSIVDADGVDAKSPCSNTEDGNRVQRASFDSMSLVIARSSRRPGEGKTLVPINQPRSANAPTRHPSSKRLRSEGIRHQVHGEARVVDRQKAFTVGMI